MIIQTNIENFEDIEAGTLFGEDGYYYLKVDPVSTNGNPMNAVNVLTGEVFSFPKNRMVIPYRHARIRLE